MGRHMAGLRMPIFAMSGIYGVKLRTFWLYDGLGLLVSAPAVIGIGYYFAKNLHKIMYYLQRVEVILVLAVLGIGVAYWLIKRRKRQRAKEEQRRSSLPIMERPTRPPSAPAPSTDRAP